MRARAVPVEAEIGSCCICDKPGAVNLLMLERLAPEPGKGWGCVVCGLACDGAVAVLCDRCCNAYRNGGKPLKYVCRGYPSQNDRMAYAELSAEPFEHDKAAHQADEARG